MRSRTQVDGVGRQGYPDEVRRRALELSEAGRGAIQVAHALNVSVQSVYRWRAEAAEPHDPDAGTSRADTEPSDDAQPPDDRASRS